MRHINVVKVQNTVRDLFLKANVNLPLDIEKALAKANENETNEHAKFMIEKIIENAQIAKENNWPLCQDTGMAVIFLDIGQEVHFIGGDLEQAINQGVREAYKLGGFRNSVADPLTRENTNDNTPGIIHYSIVKGDQLLISVAPKGFGSENMSRAYMLDPTANDEEIIDHVKEAVIEASGKPCPPLVLGIGIGGSLEKAALIAKRALLRDISQSSDRDDLAELEKKILKVVNNTNVGVQGLAGINTALAVNIEAYPTHIAGLPLVINFQCHAARHCSEVI